MNGQARIDTFESTESGYSAEISSPANRVCKSILHDRTSPYDTCNARRRLGKLESGGRYFFALSLPARSAKRNRTNARGVRARRRYSLTSREMNHTLFRAARASYARSHVRPKSRGETTRRAGELWKESGSIDREIYRRRRRRDGRLSRPRERPRRLSPPVLHFLSLADRGIVEVHPARPHVSFFSSSLC